MLWYLGALGSYCLGYAAYAGVAHLGAPVLLARVIGVMIGLTPLGIWLFRRILGQLLSPSAAAQAGLTESQRHPDGCVRGSPSPSETYAPAGDSRADLVAIAIVEPERALPCRRCGAAMAPFATAGLAGELDRLHCRFCQLVDDVPRDAALRLAFLRARAAELRRTRQALSDTDRRVAEVLEDGRWIRGTLLAALGPLSLILLLVVLPAALTGGAKGALIGLGLISQLTGIVLGMWLAYRAVSRRYLRTIRPRILARAPERPGAPARCRVCGGAIEFRGAAFCDCSFCGAANLIGTDLLRDAHRFLGEEVAEYQRRAAGAEREVATHHKLMAYGIVAGNILGSMLGAAALTALGAALWNLFT